MKTIYIPKGETVRYETIATENLVVKGCLEVAGNVSAKHISGGGIIHAQSIAADSICADELEAGIVTCKRLIAKRVSAPEVFASESTAVSCLLSAAYVETGRLTVAISDIDQVKAVEVINLTPKKRGLFGTLLASALRAFWLSCFAKPAKSGTDEVMDAEFSPMDDSIPREHELDPVISPENMGEEVPAEQTPAQERMAAEESEDFELKRIVAQFKLARESGYTLQLIPGTPEGNAPVFPFEAERALVRPVA